IASASWDKTVHRLWNTATGAHQQTLEGHGDVVTALAFLPDGQLAASASKDKTVRLWNTVTGAQLQTLPLGLTESLAFGTSSSTSLLIDFGAIDLLTNSLTGESLSPEGIVLAPDTSSLSLSLGKRWSMKEGQKIIWLPIKYRPTSSAVRGSVIFIGCSSGHVIRIIV
ncbi:WD40-repeat-containing domain protein, partial [Microdochium bolleyi]